MSKHRARSPLGARKSDVKLDEKPIMAGLYAPAGAFSVSVESESAGSDESRLLELWRPSLPPRQAIGGSPPRAISVCQVRKKYRCRNSAQSRRNSSPDPIAGVCS